MINSYVILLKLLHCESQVYCLTSGWVSVITTLVDGSGLRDLGGRGGGLLRRVRALHGSARRVANPGWTGFLYSATHRTACLSLPGWLSRGLSNTRRHNEDECGEWVQKANGRGSLVQSRPMEAEERGIRSQRAAFKPARRGELHITDAAVKLVRRLIVGRRSEVSLISRSKRLPFCPSEIS